jgi:hypothetical protein
MVVLGLGLGMVMQVLVLAVQSTVDIRDLGSATSAASFFRSIGGSVGVSVFAALFNSSLTSHLKSALPAGIDPGSLHGSPAELAKLPAAVHAIYTEAFVVSLQGVFHVAIFFAAAGFAISLLLPNITLRGTSGAEAATSGAGLAAVGQQFGLVDTGATAVHEEIRARLHGAQAALARIDVLTGNGHLGAACAANLRCLYLARVADLTAGADRASERDGAERPNPATWRAALDLLRVERLILTSAALVGASVSDPVARARAERDLRVDALHAAMSSLDGLDHSDLSERDRSALRDLITDRVNSLTAHDATVIDPTADGQAGPSDGLWSAVGDVLATERRALAALKPELSPDTGARLERDDSDERDALTITPA